MSLKIKGKHLIAALSIILLFLVVIPLFLLAPYDYASCDDFSYGIDTHRIFLQTHSIGAVLKTALSTVGHFYRTWQGSFSAIFLMAIQPAVWNEEAYCVTTYIVITFLVLSEMLLAKCVIRDCLKSDHSTWVTVISLVLSVQILWVPYPVEAFFWYNGSIYYSLYYSFSLLYYCLLIRMLQRDCRRYLVPAVFLGIVIGGGNYPVALLALEISALMGLYVFAARRERLKWILPPAAALLVAFLVNALAPGNAVRQANNTMTPAFTSVVKSLYEGVLLIAKWSTLAALRTEQWETLYNAFRSYLIYYCAVMLLFYTASLPFYGYQTATSVSAYYALRSGAAAQYRTEQRARHAMLENSELTELGLPELSVRPYLLFFDDIEEDPDDWKNSAAADFYGKQKL